MSSNTTPICPYLRPQVGGFSGILKGQYGITTELCTKPTSTIGDLYKLCSKGGLKMYGIDGVGINTNCFYKGEQNKDGVNGVACLYNDNGWCKGSDL